MFYKLLIKGRLRHLKESQKALAANNPNLVNNVFDVQGHFVVGHKNLLELGYAKIRNRVEERLNQVNQVLGASENVATSPEEPSDYESMVKIFENRFQIPEGRVTEDHRAFLQSLLVVIDAAIKYIERFAQLARTQAAEKRTTGDVARAEKLMQTSKSCEWVAKNPPRTFHEALQLMWFNQVIATIAHGMPCVLAIGRTDQYLYPFFRNDIEHGVLNEEDALELCEELLIKLSYNLLILPSYAKATGSELGADNAAITLGGIGPDGKDAVNELSYLFLQATENVKSMTNSVSIRIAPGITDPHWSQRTMDVYAATSGPAIFNDDVIIPALQKDGVSLEDARDYAIIGCVEPSPQGNTFGTTSGNDISLVGLLEMIFTNGVIRNVSVHHGVQTGPISQITKYEELWGAYKIQMEYIVEHMAKLVNIKDFLYATRYPNPFISATTTGCIESGLDVTQGGAQYNFGSLVGRGLATTANSLCALKKVVFEEGKLSMIEMKEILDRNFQGHERLLAELKNKIPKFGNDDEYVDAIAVDIARTFYETVHQQVPLRGGCFRVGYFSFGMYLIDGFFLGATPDGRLAGEPVSNSLSPANNTEKQGPTAVFNSVAKIDGTTISNGLALNMRLLPVLLENPDMREKLTSLLHAYFAQGGMEVQFNVVNQEELIEARIHPENFLDLVVRVSGYCAYFVDLGAPLQEDIIQRYSFNV